MRKFFDRLRRWLIKKLGGYTEQLTPVRKETVRLPDAKAKKVQVQVIESRPVLYGNMNHETFLKSRAIEEIARHLEEKGYIKWERTGDIERCAIILRATLWVVSAEELEQSVQWWLE